MSTTVVGVFDAYGDAERAADRLVAECGLDRSAVRVTGGDAGSASSSAETQHRDPPGGIRGFFAELFGLGDDDDAHGGEYSEAVRRGSAVVTADLTDESRLDEVRDTLEECGAIDIDERVQQWRATGWSGRDADAPSTDASQSATQRSGGAEVLPVVQEELQVGKREVERGRVRVHRRVVERPVEEQLSLREEHAVVERQAVDRPASAADLDAALQDRDIEVRETAEEPVVSKRARVVEEVRVGKEASERTETVRDTVRRTDVDIDDETDVPASGRLGGAGGMLSRNYSGPERRISTDTYSGVDRRAPH